MADTVKTLVIDLKVNRDSLNKAIKDAEVFDKPLLSNVLSDEQLSKMKEAYTAYQAQARELESTNALIAETAKLQTAGIGDFTEELNALMEKRDALQKSLGLGTEDEPEEQKANKFTEALKKGIENIGSSIQQWVNGKFSKWGDDIYKIFTDAISNAWDEAANMASYDMSTSLTSNAAARNLMLQYGMSSGQAWAYSQVSDLLNIQSEEDLYYMGEAERAKFIELMDKYTAKYEEYSESGIFEAIQEFQLEWEEFKLDLQMDFIEWFADNKDLLKSVLEGLMYFMQWVIEALGALANVFSADYWAETLASTIGATSDYVNNSSSMVSAVSTTYNNQTYSNTNNNYGSSSSDDAMSKTRAWYMELTGG